METLSEQQTLVLALGRALTTQALTFELHDGQWIDQNYSILENYSVQSVFPKSGGDGSTAGATVQVASSNEDLYRKNLIMMVIADTIGRQVVRGVLLNSDFSSSITTLNVSSFAQILPLSMLFYPPLNTQ